MTRIAIIGGGISGLSAAFALEPSRRAGAVEYMLYESSPQLGGVLRTEHIDKAASSKPDRIPSSPKSPGPPTSAAPSASAISSSAQTTPIAKLTSSSAAA
jgi:cation diffusion facilitator CzcD-associated flavoprotein CzcO